MNRKVCLFFLFCFYTLTLTYAQKVGEKVYKPFSLWDKVEYRWGKCIIIDEYDLEGKVIITNTERGITRIEYEYYPNGKNKTRKVYMLEERKK